MVVSSADKAIANANAQGSCEPGYCLKYTRQWLDIPSREADAKGAWDTAIGKHPDDKHPPKGAPVFWKGGTNGHGHIALAKADNMRTTDKPTGQVGNDPGSYPREQWGLEYVGWAEGFNGVRIPYLGGNEAGAPDWMTHGDVHVVKLKKGVTDSKSVSRLRYRLTTHNQMPDGKKPGLGNTDPDVGGSYGADVVEASKWWMQNVYHESHGNGENWNNAMANQIFGDAYNVIEE